MDIRMIGRGAFVALLVGALTTWVLSALFKVNPGNIPWFMLLLAGIILAALFTGWGTVGTMVALGARKATPHVQAAGQAFGVKAKSNIAATAAIICLIFSAAFGFAGKMEPTVFFLYGSAVFAIVHYKDVDHIMENWKEYWLAASVVGALHTFTFDYGWKSVAAFILSAMLAGTVLVFGGKAVIKGILKGIYEVLAFLGRLFLGKYTLPAAFLTWTVSSVLVALFIPALAFPAMILAVGCFIAAFLMGTKKYLVK